AATQSPGVAEPRSSRWFMDAYSVPSWYARPYAARMPLATTRRFEPSVAKETIAAEERGDVAQWSHVAETPITRRPSRASTRLLFSAPGTGPSRIVARGANLVPRKPVSRSTPSSELTYRLSPTQTSPSGPRIEDTTFTGSAR